MHGNIKLFDFVYKILDASEFEIYHISHIRYSLINEVYCRLETKEGIELEFI